MSLKKLTAFVVLSELIAMGMMLSVLLFMTAKNGGVATFDMTMYGERLMEYYILLVLMAVTPYALYVAFDVLPNTKHD